MKTRPTLAVVSSLALLAVLLLTFPNELNDVPKQDWARWTGYPAWHPKIKGFDQEKGDAFTFLAIVLMLSLGTLSVRWTFVPELPKRLQSTFYKDGIATPTTLFNQMLAVYILITWIAAVTYFFVDVGKVWCVVGLAHNMLELAILLLLHQGGRIRSNSFFAWLGIYVLVVAVPSIGLDWPYDGVWFKVQGLCIDWALLITLTWIHIITRGHLNEESSTQLPLTLNENTSIFTNSAGPSKCEFWPTSMCHPWQLLLLVGAMSIHTLGNIANSVWLNRALAFYMFQVSYCVAFPLIAYYVYLDTHCGSPLGQKRIYLPSTSHPKAILTVLWALFLSFLTLRVAFMVDS